MTPENHTKSVTMGWLCWPQRNRGLAFQGSMLHGVMLRGVPVVSILPVGGIMKAPPQELGLCLVLGLDLVSGLRWPF